MVMACIVMAYSSGLYSYGQFNYLVMANIVIANIVMANIVMVGCFKVEPSPAAAGRSPQHNLHVSIRPSIPKKPQLGSIPQRHEAHGRRNPMLKHEDYERLRT